MGKFATYIKWTDIFKWTDILIEDNTETSTWDACLLFIGAHMTLRWSDLSLLQWKTVLSQRFVIKECKTKKKKKIFVPDKSLAVMEKLFLMTRTMKGATKNDPIFVSREGTIVHLNYPNRRLHKLEKRFQPGHEMTTHSLRKSGPRMLFDANPTMETLVRIQIMLNHRDIGTTLLYLGIRDTEIEDMYKSFNP